MVIDWLVEASLPTSDLAEHHLSLVAERDAQAVGAVGLERYGATALLRSLVVVPSAQRQGVARALIDALEKDAKADGVEELWLLTTDKSRFFQGLGYVLQSRERAPGTIRSSREFSVLCPSDATLMSKVLR